MTSRTSGTQDLARNVNSQAHLKSSESETLVGGALDVFLTSCPGGSGVALGTTVREGDYSMSKNMLRYQNVKAISCYKLKIHKAADAAIGVGSPHMVEEN